jgi:hypothetical protein
VQWQEDAFNAWVDDLQDKIALRVQPILAAMTRSEIVTWLPRFFLPREPVAEALAEWLIDDRDKRWWVVAADRWDRVETPEGGLIAYPAYLGWDPLAMAASGWVWADRDPRRVTRVGQKLGAAALLAALAGQLPQAWWGFDGQTYCEAYGSWLSQWRIARADGEREDPERCRVPVDWPPLPSYQHYLRQLEYGVVPHEAGNHMVGSEAAVLVALHQVDPKLRRQAAGLAFKALEGRWLMLAWRKDLTNDGGQ